MHPEMEKARAAISLTGVKPTATQAAVPPPRADANDLVSALLFNSGSYQADGQVHTDTWHNTTGKRMLITACKLWAGFQYGCLADAQSHVFRYPDSAFVAIRQEDHYQQPGGLDGSVMYLNPYMALEPDEALVFQHFASAITPQKGVHFTATVWWRYG